MDKEKAFKGLLTDTSRFLNLSVRDRSFRGLFIGFKPREYLVIDVPRSSEIGDLLGGSPTVTGMFCTAGTVVRFKAAVTDFIRKSAWLLIVAYPEMLEKIRDLRNAFRAECSFPCKLVTVSEHKEYRGVMEDVSTGGCRFAFQLSQPAQAKLFDVKKEVLLEFELPGSAGKKGLFGEILHVSRYGSEILLGIKFSDNNDAETTEALHSYIVEMIKSVPS